MAATFNDRFDRSGPITSMDERERHLQTDLS
jgi:hypothetical protein